MRRRAPAGRPAGGQSCRGLGFAGRSCPCPTPDCLASKTALKRQGAQRPQNSLCVCALGARAPRDKATPPHPYTLPPKSSNCKQRSKAGRSQTQSLCVCGRAGHAHQAQETLHPPSPQIPQPPGTPNPQKPAWRHSAPDTSAATTQGARPFPRKAQGNRVFYPRLVMVGMNTAAQSNPEPNIQGTRYQGA